MIGADTRTDRHDVRVRPWPAAIVLAAAPFLVLFDSLAVATALPAIGAELGLRPGLLQWVVTLQSLSIGALLVLGGRAADLWGRRRVLVASLGCRQPLGSRSGSLPDRRHCSPGGRYRASPPRSRSRPRWPRRPQCSRRSHGAAEPSRSSPSPPTPPGWAAPSSAAWSLPLSAGVGCSSSPCRSVCWPRSPRPASCPQTSPRPRRRVGSTSVVPCSWSPARPR